MIYTNNVSLRMQDIVNLVNKIDIFAVLAIFNYK